MSVLVTVRTRDLAAAQEAAGVVFAAFELQVDVLMAMGLNGSEVEALLSPANATNVSSAGAAVISAVLFRRGQGHTLEAADMSQASGLTCSPKAGTVPGALLPRSKQRHGGNEYSTCIRMPYTA